MKDFSLKFLDIMVAVVLGLGFQWWPALHEPWQFAAFVFVYFDIVDYWIDYGPSLKKWPPKREIDVLLDVGIMFALFLYVYTTQTSIVYFLSSFILLRVVDSFWLLRCKHEYRPKSGDALFLNAWLRLGTIEIFGSAVLIALALLVPSFTALLAMGTFIVFRVAMRILASFMYKKVHFA